ncbi:MAG: ATP phosphoribosyltransferase regulatory subunit [Lentisphaeria bacterium]|nr:ATP phosphoribosyltransferase regulatory subunit [Lentisphaeria bacterium]
MSKEFQNLKGTYDYLPERQILRENIKSTLQSIFIKYGFAPVETPILCGYDLLASKYSEGADILNETYKLTDQGKRSLGLRYDLTITFSKLISFNPSMTMPFKRYEIGKVFRDGPVKLGRNREFTQCDIDVVGTSSLLAEAEYMTMTEEAYRKLGLDVEILYNNRKLLNGLIKAVFGDVDENVLRQSIMLIDKFAKLTKKELVYEFSKIGVTEEKVEEISSVLALSFDDLCKKIAEYPASQIAAKPYPATRSVTEVILSCHAGTPAHMTTSRQALL